LTMPAYNVTLFAKWLINQYTISFESNGGSAVESITQDFGSEVTEPNEPEKAGYYFSGWFTNEQQTTPYTFTTMPAENVALHAKWLGPNMVQVGELGTTYTIPIEPDDSRTATVEGGYLMATTETTYELWYEVRVWAEANGYFFQNFGLPGSHDSNGDGWWVNYPSEAPAVNEDNKNQPVTYVSWRDVIVWTNALSEMTGLDPVYRIPEGVIIKDSRDSNASQVDSAIQTENNGYRLPTSMEWEMAARWRNGSGDGAILVDGRHWTPGDYASGATADYNNEAETRAVAWYSGATGGNFTRPVGQMMANHLGLYDMSGNVWEWTFSSSGSLRVVRGGNSRNVAYYTQVGYVLSDNPGYAGDGYGFRLVLGQ
jgi:formylglycine-generating enzyme